MKNFVVITLSLFLSGCITKSLDKGGWAYLDKDQRTGKYNYAATNSAEANYNSIQQPVANATQQIAGIGQNLATQVGQNLVHNYAGPAAAGAVALIPNAIAGGNGLVQAGTQLGTQALAQAVPQGQLIGQLSNQVLGLAQQGFPVQNIVNQAMGFANMGLNNQQILGTTLGVLTNPQSGLGDATANMARQSICSMANVPGCNLMAGGAAIGQVAQPIINQAATPQGQAAIQHGMGLYNALAGLGTQ